MKNKIILICMTFMLLSSCNLFAQNTVPYLIEGKIVTDESEKYENIGFEGALYNKSSKSLSSFTFVFFGFDEDGNSPLLEKNNVVLKVEDDISSGTKYEFCISLDDLFPLVSIADYEVEYLYVSRLEYSDGSEWTDPLGFAVF